MSTDEKGADDAELRRSFLAGREYALDPFQLEALDILDSDRSVLVAAPTGSGKTVVAEYAVERALSRGQRAFYTTPLKALSNQKYRDFVATYGRSRVGLLTGDISLNGNAPVVVMTTEVLRNMIYAAPERLASLQCVVLDEVHFLEDRYRGAVWEEIILSAPATTVLVCLSATVSNAEELASWMTTVRGSTGVVIEERRPIELRNLFVAAERVSHELVVLPVFRDGVANPDALALDACSRRQPQNRSPRNHYQSRQSPRVRNVGPLARARRTEVIERFAADDLLPAIYFVFSRAGCDEAVRQCRDIGVSLTTAEEREEIREIADSFFDELSDADLRVLGYRGFMAGLEAGLAAHHAGMVPPFREAVEALFTRSLVKAVFATETLALGINMPARSVIIESLSKFSGAGHADITPGEYTQLTGRAGRRGIDPLGYAAVLWSPIYSFEEVASLASSRTRALRSSFRPNYNMAINLVRRYSRDDARRLVRSSFAQYLSDVPLTRQLDAVLELLGERGYVAGWRVTDSGDRLGRIYHDADLLIAEAYGQGLFGGLDAPSLVALVSTLTFEARRMAGNDLPTAKVARRYGEIEGLATELRDDERRAGLPRTRQPDGGFARLAYQWAQGAELRELLRPPPSDGRRVAGREQSMTGGDFVRNVKQLIDLLRQLAMVDPESRVAKAARQGSDALARGIVAASSGVSAPSEEVADDPR